MPQAKFGLAFNESSGACLTRVDGKEDGLRDTAIRNSRALGCAHVLIQNAYPISVWNAIRNVPEVCSIFWATANPVFGSKQIGPHTARLIELVLSEKPTLCSNGGSMYGLQIVLNGQLPDFFPTALPTTVEFR